MMEQNEHIEVEHSTPISKPKWRKKLVYFILFILLTPLVLTLLIHVSFVQNWAVNLITSKVSERIEETVGIDYVDFSIFKGLQLEGFNIVDSKNDTLLNAKSLDVSLSRNLFSILKGEIAIKSISLTGTNLHATKPKGAVRSNLEDLLKKLGSNSKPKQSAKPGKKLKIQLQEVDILDLQLSYYDEAKAITSQLTSKALYILVNDINIDSNRYDIRDLSIKDLDMLISKGIIADEKPIIEKTKGPIANQDKKTTNRLSLNIDRMLVQNSSFAMSDDNKSKNTRHFDQHNFSLNEIDLYLNNFELDSLVNIKGDIETMSLKDNKGFVLQDFKSMKSVYNQKSIVLPNLEFTTDKSFFSSNFELSYRNRDALKDIMKKTIVEATLNNVSISIDDLLHFVPSLDRTGFFQNNRTKAISIDGDFSGRIANIKGSDVKLSIPGVLDAIGDFGTRNLDSPAPLINLRMESLNTSIEKLKKVIPELNPPANFYKLGNINFKGNFDGYPKDFVAYGTIVSELGTVKTDMRLDLKKGVNLATYSGDIALKEFDLLKWSDNEDFGFITFVGKVRNGKGLTLNNAYADLEGSLKSFDYKNYLYKNININGAIDKSKFDGKISSSDLNFNFGFDGFAEYVDNKINFDFAADVGIIDFKAINLSKDQLVLRGNLDIKGTGSNIDDLIGSVDARNINITKNDTIYIFDSLIVQTYFEGIEKILNLATDGSTINIKGQYVLGTIVDDFQSIIKKNYPYHTKDWTYIPKEISKGQKVNFDIKLRNNKTIFEILNISTTYEADTLYAKGYLNSEDEQIDLITTLPYLDINENLFSGLFIHLTSTKDKGDLDIRIEKSKVSKQNLNAITLNTKIDGDLVNFHLNTDNIIDSLQNFDISGTLTPFQNGYTTTLDENNIRIYGRRWKINPDNKISLDKKYIDIEHFAITDGIRTLEINDINNKGLRVNISKFSIDLFNQFLADDRLNFTGNAYSNIRINDIFQKSPDIYGNILMTDLKINGDSYGELNMDISKPVNKPLDAIVSFNNDANGQTIKLTASIDLDQKRVDANLKAKNVPLKIVEYLLYKGMKETEGTVDIEGDIYGAFDNIKINTRGQTNNTKTKVIVLGETYSFYNQKFTITDEKIDLNGAILTDSEGGTGRVSGYLGHKLFKDFYLACSVLGENVVALNTTKFDNSTYYGLGKGNVFVDFTGSVNYPNINITAETTKGTTLSIPIQSTQSANDKSFIKFIDKETYFTDGQISDPNVVKIDGVSLEMNLVMTPEAKVFLIFDEAKGDIIEGIGDGNLQINMNRNGDFEIFGEYEIRQGKYLFTAFSFVNKPFIVREGGKVRWNGDPVNATLDIMADYAVRTDLSLFLAEYLATDALIQAASNRTDVNLQMIISNKLYNPTINFGLEFPDLTGDLKSYADSKVRLLSNNQNDLNNQVFGLIVFNTFLPSNTLSEVITSGSVIQSAGVNTLSEFVSSQLSSYVTRFLNETLEENGLISGIDFDITLRNNYSLGPIGGNSGAFSVVPTEIEVKLKNQFRFQDGRLSFDLGGNYVRESLIGLSNYVVPEFTFRYALTPDRKLNLKVYGKYDLDEISVTSRRQRLGVGIRYRTEFGSMLDTKSIIKKSLIQVPAEVLN